MSTNMNTTLPPPAGFFATLAHEQHLQASATRPAPATCEALAQECLDGGWECDVDFGNATVILDGDTEWLDFEVVITAEGF